MTHRLWLSAIAMGIVLAAWAGPARAEIPYTWEGGLSFSYLRGDYGQDQSTDIYYGVLMLKRYLSQGDVAVTIPYLDIPDDGVTFVGGDLERVAGSGGGSGLGDIILKGRYYAVEQDSLVPFIDLVGSVKFPIAKLRRGFPIAIYRDWGPGSA